MYPSSVQKLITLFSKFPGVGPKTAARFVFYLLKISPEKTEELTLAIKDLRGIIKSCGLCFNFFEPQDKEERFCGICSNPTRNKSRIMVVEKEADLESIEKIKKYKGLYFVLGGTISGFKKEIEKKNIEVRVNELIKRINVPIEEVILALNPTTEGENTALWLKRKLEPLKVKITQLGRGLPVGGELEYADEETLASALKGRS